MEQVFSGQYLSGRVSMATFFGSGVLESGKGAQRFSLRIGRAGIGVPLELPGTAGTWCRRCFSHDLKHKLAVVEI